MPYRLGPNGEKIMLGITTEEPSNQTYSSQTSSTRTGRTPEEHYQAWQKAVSAGDTKSASVIKTSYDMESAYQQQIGANKPDEAAEKKKGILNSAQTIENIINNKDKMDEKSYRDALNSASSDLYLKMKEGEKLGTQLTPGEIAILAGKAPLIKRYGASLGSLAKQLFTGELPVQRGEVLDDERTLMNKMAIIKAGMTGQPLSPEQLASLNQTAKYEGGAQSKLKSFLETPINLPDWAERQMSIATQETPVTTLSTSKQKERAVAEGTPIEQASWSGFGKNILEGGANIIGGTAVLAEDLFGTGTFKVNPDTGEIVNVNLLTGQKKGEALKGLVDIPATVLNQLYKLGHDPLSTAYNEPIETAATVAGVNQLFNKSISTSKGLNLFKAGEEVPPTQEVSKTTPTKASILNPKKFFGQKEEKLLQGIKVDSSSIVKAGEDAATRNPEIASVEGKFKWNETVGKIDTANKLLTNVREWGNEAFDNKGQVYRTPSAQLQAAYWKAGWEELRKVAPQIAAYQEVLKWSYRVPKLGKVLWNAVLAKVLLGSLFQSNY